MSRDRAIGTPALRRFCPKFRMHAAVRTQAQNGRSPTIARLIQTMREPAKTESSGHEAS